MEKKKKNGYNIRKGVMISPEEQQKELDKDPQFWNKLREYVKEYAETGIMPKSSNPQNHNITTVSCAACWYIGKVKGLLEILECPKCMCRDERFRWQQWLVGEVIKRK